MSESAILFRNVSRHFGDVKAVDDVTLEITDGQFFTPYSLVREDNLPAYDRGFRPSHRKIFLYGQDVSDLPPYERDVNTVFQD